MLALAGIPKTIVEPTGNAMFAFHYCMQQMQETVQTDFNLRVCLHQLQSHRLLGNNPPTAGPTPPLEQPPEQPERQLPNQSSERPKMTRNQV